MYVFSLSCPMTSPDPGEARDVTARECPDADSNRGGGDWTEQAEEADRLLPSVSLQGDGNDGGVAKTEGQTWCNTVSSAFLLAAFIWN